MLGYAFRKSSLALSFAWTLLALNLTASYILDTPLLLVHDPPPLATTALAWLGALVFALFSERGQTAIDQALRHHSEFEDLQAQDDEEQDQDVAAN